MTNSNTFHADLLVGELQQVLQFQPDNVTALCEIGRKLTQAGRTEDARKCYRASVDALRQAARAGDVDRALDCELAIYNAFVKTVEDDQHYYRCFSGWKDELAALGRRFRDPAALPDADADRSAFLLQTGPMLGHTEVLLKMLESRPRTGARHTEPRIYVLEAFEETFLQRCRQAGVEVVLLVHAMPNWRLSSWRERFVWLRKRFDQDRIGICIWVTAPTMASFALSMRLARVQVFWALRFHPIAGPFIDGYITYGARQERERVFGRQKWIVCPPPLTIDAQPVEPAAVAAVRAKYPESFLFGTIAREEKINSKRYLECVARILQLSPQAGYLWTGKQEHPGIIGFMRDAGVAERCHFVGWVDVNLFANALDVFLETFPLGGGVSGYCALAGGVPLVSYLTPYTVLGNHLWHERSADRFSSHVGGAVPDTTPLSSDHILCARNPDEYVAFATRLVTDNAFRQAVGRAGQAFYKSEANSTREYSQRFFDTIHSIAHAKRSAGAPEKA